MGCEVCDSATKILVSIFFFDSSMTTDSGPAHSIENKEDLQTVLCHLKILLSVPRPGFIQHRPTSRGANALLPPSPRLRPTCPDKVDLADIMVTYLRGA